jgi:WD40 repeat protein
LFRVKNQFNTSAYLRAIDIEATMNMLRSLALFVFSSMLLFGIVEASPLTPQAPPLEPKDSPKATPTAVKTEITVPPVVNPRGEALFFENGSEDIQPVGLQMWTATQSPDGKTIATAHGYLQTLGEIRIWDRDTAKIKKSVSLKKGVRYASFSPDGKLLASASFDGTLRFHDPATFAVWAVGDESSGGHKPTGINSLCFFNKGKYIATGGFDSTVRLWDVAAILSARKASDTVHAAPVAILEGNTNVVLSVAVSEDGKTVVSGGFDFSVRVWNLPDALPKMGEKPLVVKKEAANLAGHESAVEAVGISPDGQHIASAAQRGKLLVRDKTGANREINAQFNGGIACLTFSRDGKYLAVGGGFSANPPNKEIRVYDVAEKKEITKRSDFSEGVKGLEFTPDGKTLIVAVRDQTVHVWPWSGEKDQQKLTPTGQGYAPQPLMAAAVSPNGTYLVFSGESQSVFVMDRSLGKMVAELKEHEDVVAGIVFSPDGKTLATASYDKTIKLWDTETWTLQRTLTGHKGWVFSVAFSPNGKALASGSYDKTIRIWEPKTGESKTQFDEHTAGIRSVAFSPDGKKLVSGGSDRIVRVWDIAEGKVLLALKGHKKAVRSVAFSPDGKSVVTGSEDQTVKLWDAESGKETTEFAELPDMVTAVGFSPKGQTLAVGTFQGSIALLDPISGRNRQMLRAHNEAVTSVLYTDEGKHIISCSQDNGIRQWSVSKTPVKAPAVEVAVKTGTVSTAASTPDGTFVVLGISDGSIKAWDLLKGTLLPYPVKHPVAIAHIAVSEGMNIASIGKDESIILSSRDGKVIWKGKGSFAAFTVDGKFVAAVEGKEIVLRESATGKEVRRFVGGHDGEVVRIDFSPDGKLLASAGLDTKVRLWNVASGDKLQATPAFGNASKITYLSFSPDGNRFAVSAYGPEQPPPDDMTGMFRPVRDVRVYSVPKADATFANPILFSPQPPNQPITGLLWDRYGQLLVMPASDGTVRYNDFVNNNPRETQRFRAHDGAALAAVMTNDAFVTVGEDMAVRKWYLPQPPVPPRAAMIVGAFKGSPVGVGEFDPSGHYLFASAAWDKQLQVFLQPPNPSVLMFGGSYGGVSAVAYSPDGKHLATGHENGELLLWDATTGRRLGRFSGLESWVKGVAFTPDGNSLVAVSQGTEKPEQPGEAVVFDVPTQKIRLHLSGPIGHPWQVVLNREGTIAAAPCSDGAIRFWDLTSGNMLRTIDAHPTGTRAVAFSPDGKILVSGGFDGTLRFWNTSTWEQTRVVELPDAFPNGIAFTPNGREIVIATLRKAQPPADRIDCSIFALRANDPDSELRQFGKGHAGAAVTIVVLKDGKTVVSGGGRVGELGEIKVWDLPSGKLLGDFRGHSTVVEALAVAPDGQTVVSGAWAAGQPGELRQWNAGGFRPSAVVPGITGPYVGSAGTSPDGKILALGSGDGAIAVFDMSDPAKPVRRHMVETKHSKIGSLVFDAAGKRFVTSDEKGKVIVWDAEKVVPLKEWQASSTLIVYRAKFTPDGKSVVTSAGNWKDPKIPGEMRVWNPLTGEEIARFPDQSAGVWDFAFLDEGKTLVSTQACNGAKGEAPVKVWDFATRTEKRSITIPGGMRCLAVSPDEQYLAVGNHSGETKLISTRTWQVISSTPPHSKVVFRLGFSADSRMLLSLSEDGAVGVTRVPEQR